MLQIKLNENGMAQVEIKRGVELRVRRIDGAYDLEYRDYNTRTGFGSSMLCENKKRLSTINKEASRFGVEFVI